MARNALAYLLATLAIVIWGGVPAATQIAVRGIDAVTVGMLRTIIAAVILFPLALLLRFPIPRDRECWIAVIVSAWAGFVGYTLLFTVGQKFTSTAHAAIISAAAPIFTGFIGFAVERKWARSIWWVGAIIALVGEGILITYRTSGLVRDATLAGDLLVLVSALFVSAGYVTGGRSSSKIGAWPTTAWSISLAGLTLAPVLLWRLGTIHFASLSSDLSSWLAVVYLAVFTSIVGYAAWYGAIGLAGVARISPILFGSTFVSLAIAAAVLGETITAPILIAVLVMLAGLAIMRRSNER